MEDLKADLILYVIGAPQDLHLGMVWDTARRAGWLPDTVQPVHVQIGNVLGQDRKILKTRSGTPFRLMALLDESVATARAVMDEDQPDLDVETRDAMAPQVGIGAVKYADLSVAHSSEYVFDLRRMVSLNGNTSRYLQYAAARLRSIFRTAGMEPADVHGNIRLKEPGERALALKLIGFGDVVAQVGNELEPHRLCGYLFELAQAFSVFYERCPVLKAEADLRESRLSLSAATLRALITGLDLLGIDAPQRM